MDTKWILAGIAIIAALLLGGWYVMQNRSTTDGGTQTPVTSRTLKTYYDERYGIAFNFPDTYAVKENDSTGEGAKRHSIIVGEKSAIENPPVDSEAPPAITIDIYANPQNQSAEAWVKGNNNSNFKLSPDGQLTPIKVGGEDAMAYGWDGLYRSTSIVLNHKKQIFMLSVGSNAPSDQIVKDFAEVVASIQFDP